MKTRVALITHDFASGGGTATMTRFLYRVLSRSEEFEPGIVSLATSNSDRASVLARKPSSWGRPPRILDQDAGGIGYRHAGALFPELEFQRYAARRPLSDLLAGFDILQFVIGIPAWACAAGERLPESLIWFATLARGDRASRIEASTGLRRWNYTVMTAAAESREKKALREARLVVALSNYSANQAKPITPADRLRMIPCGIDTDAYVPDPSASGDYILCVGRLSDPRKNIRLLLDAYHPSLPDLYLVGEPPGAAETAEIERGKAASRVRIAGLKRGAELAEIYRRALMLVVPSEEEGLGIVILEAMASGIPVVSTRCGGPETAVVDGVTGYLTPKGDAAALREAMLRIAGDRALRNRMGQAARARAQEVFSLEAVGEQFLHLYREMPVRS